MAADDPTQREEEAVQRPLRLPWWRRVLRVTVAGLVSVVVTVLGIVALLLFSPAFCQTVLRQGVSIYDGLIPGGAEVESIEGSLASRLELRGVVLRDRTGLALVSVEHLGLGLDMNEALRGTITLGVVELRGADITLPSGDEGGFGDLAPESDAEPKPKPPPDPDAGIGPDFPVVLDLVLAVERVRLLRAVPDGDPEVMVDLSRLDLHADARGTEAAAQLELAVDVPVAGDLKVPSLVLEAGWDSPVVRVERLDIDSTWGAINLEPTSLDFSNFDAYLEELSVEADPEWFADTTKLPAEGGPTVALDAAGSPRAAGVGIRAQIPGLIDAKVRLDAAVEPELDARVAVDTTVALHRLVPSLKAEQVSVGVRLHAHGDPADRVLVDGTVMCVDCDPKGLPVVIALDGEAKPQTKTARADVLISAAGGQLYALAAIDEGNTVGLTAQIDFPDLKRIADIAETFVARPDLAGRADLDVDCGGTLEPRDLRCDVAGGIDRGKPVERASIDLTATLAGDDLRAEIRDLDVNAQGVSISSRTRGGPAVVAMKLGEPAISVEGLGFGVGTQTGGAGVSVNGQIDPQGESDLSLRLTDIDLAAANSFVPDLGLSGRADVAVDVTGPGTGPSVRATVRGRNLAYKGRSLGTLDVDARYDPSEAKAKISLVDGPAGTVTATARIPLDLDLANEKIGPRAEPWDFELHIKDADLRKLGKFAPEPVPVDGRVDLDLVVRGGGAGKVDLDVAARDLRFDDNDLGRLELASRYRKRQLATTLDIHHPDIALAHVEADVPLTLDLNLQHPGGRWRSRDEHRVAVRIRDIDLTTAEDWAPGLGLEGNVDIEVDVDGGMDAPRIATKVDIDGVRFDDKDVGSFDVGVRYEDALVKAEIRGDSPMARDIRIDAEAPVVLSPANAKAPFSWDPAAPHVLHVGLGGIELAAARPWAPDLPPLDGRGVVSVDLTGSVERPDVAVGVAISDFAYDEGIVGDVSVDAHYGEDRAELGVVVRHDARRQIELAAVAPIHVAPLDGDVVWDEKGEHALRLDISRLDPEFLAAFTEFPEAFDFDIALDVDAKGNTDHFDVAGLLTGGVSVDGKRQPLEGKLDVHPDWQGFDFNMGGGSAGSVSLHTRAEVPVLALVNRDGSDKPDLLASPMEVAFRTDDLRLDLFSPLLPAALYDLRGGFTSSVDVDGTLGTPNFGGKATLRHGEVTVTAMRQRFEDITLDLDFDKNGATLTHFSLDAGQGSLEAKGRVALAAGDVDAHLELVTEKLPFEQPGIPRMTIGTKVITDVAVADGHTDVDVDIQDTKVDVKGANVAAPAAIPGTDRVVYVDLAKKRGEAEIAAALPDGEDGTAPAEGEDTAEPSAPSSTSISVVFTDPIALRGPAIDMEWDGSVQIESGPDGNATTGSLTNQSGRFDLLSNTFRVRRGEVTIPPGEDVIPFIDLEATTDIDEYEITASIKGRVTRPEFKLSSIPAAPESTIFGMLVSGTSTPDEGPATAKQAASILAAFSSPALQRQLNEKLNVDKVGLSFGETAAQPILSVGKNLSKNVYLETRYQFGADPSDPTKNKAEVGLRYRFKPKWSLVTYFGDAPAGGTGVFWGNAYDIEPKWYWWVPRGQRGKTPKSEAKSKAKAEPKENRAAQDVDGADD